MRSHAIALDTTARRIDAATVKIMQLNLALLVLELVLVL